jgi:hypothetical protein
MQQATNKKAPLPPEPTAPEEQPILPHSLFATAPSYLQKIVFQINACYTVTAYDACAVMVRKLVESLIIDCFEKHQIGAKIRNQQGNYCFLKDLVGKMKAEPWPSPLGRNAQSGLDSLKDVGDLSAHTKYYNAKRPYIDELKTPLRVTAERLLFLAGHKK